MSKKRKSWRQSKIEIEKIINTCGGFNDHDLSITNGILHRYTISHAPSSIFSVTYRPGNKSHIEMYLLNCVSSDGTKSFILQWKYDSNLGTCKMVKKVPIRHCIKLLIWIPSQHALVGYCTDMSLRGFNGITFKEKSKLNVYNSVLCMVYLEDFDELITAGQGYVFSWNMRLIENGFLVDPKEPYLMSEVNSSREWVHRLFYDKPSKSLLALTDEAVYVINMVIRKQVDVFYNTHKYSLTYCTFYRPFQYFITAARDGTVNIYHTGIQALIKTFPAHGDGVTGIVALSQQPILISWSERSGNICMWRLDTLEMTGLTTLSQSINELFLPRDGRLFYLTETQVQIFSVNVLYSILATLNSSIETFKLCNIRRQIKDSNTVSSHFSAESYKDKKDISATPNDSDKQLSSVFEQSESNFDPAQCFVKSLIEDESRGPIDLSFLDGRLLCILDDQSLIGVSPLTGVTLNITFPPPEANAIYFCVDAHPSGNHYYATLLTGKFLEFDSSVNPGKLSTFISLDRERQIISVGAMEMYVDEGEYKGRRVQATFLGLESGNIILCDEDVAKRKGSLTSKKSSKKKATGTSSPSNKKDLLWMTPLLAHRGKVKIIYPPDEGALVISDEVENKATIRNIVITCGTDMKIIIWRIAVLAGTSQHGWEVLFNKLHFLKLDMLPTCISVVDNVLLCGYPSGEVQMHRFAWKYFVSQTGAKIKVECNSIVLGSFKNIFIGPELFHRSSVMTAHASLLLNLFVTVGKDSLVKVWNSDGLMVRELQLGDVVQAACFAYGRNLLAALHNHIVLVEAQSFLPMDYLQQLLDLDEEGKIVEVDPEAALPMQDENGVLQGMMTQDEEEEVDDNVEPQLSGDDLKNATRKGKINHILKYLQKRSFITEIVDDSTEKGEMSAMFTGKKLQEFAPIVKIVDRAEHFVADEQRGRMVKYPVGPDGEIPNSVLRSIVKPIHALALRRAATSAIKHSRSQLVSLKDKQLMRVRRSTQGEVNVIQSDDSYPDETVQLSKRPSLSEKQVLQLSERQKWEMKDRYMLKLMELKFGTKTGDQQSKRAAINEQLKKAHESKVQVAQAESAAQVEARSRTMTALLELLHTVGKQRWCSHILTPDTFDAGFRAIADIFRRSGTRITIDILKYLPAVISTCNDLKTEDKEADLFGTSLQRQFLPRVAELLFDSLESIQQPCSDIIAKFSDELLVAALFHTVMPAFLATSPMSQKKVLNSNEKVEKAARVIKNLSNYIDTGRLYELSRLARIDDYRQVADESHVIDGIAEALKCADVDPIDLNVWANFALPLLSDQPISDQFSLQAMEQPSQQGVQPVELVKLQVKPSRQSVKRSQLNLQISESRERPSSILEEDSSIRPNKEEIQRQLSDRRASSVPESTIEKTTSGKLSSPPSMPSDQVDERIESRRAIEPMKRKKRRGTLIADVKGNTSPPSLIEKHVEKYKKTSPRGSKQHSAMPNVESTQQQQDIVEKVVLQHDVNMLPHDMQEGTPDNLLFSLHPEERRYSLKQPPTLIGVEARKFSTDMKTSERVEDVVDGGLMMIGGSTAPLHHSDYDMADVLLENDKETNQLIRRMSKRDSGIKNEAILLLQTKRHSTAKAPSPDQSFIRIPTSACHVPFSILDTSSLHIEEENKEKRVEELSARFEELSGEVASFLPTIVLPELNTVYNVNANVFTQEGETRSIVEQPTHVVDPLQMENEVSSLQVPSTTFQYSSEGFALNESSNIPASELPRQHNVTTETVELPEELPTISKSLTAEITIPQIDYSEKYPGLLSNEGDEPEKLRGLSGTKDDGVDEGRSRDHTKLASKLSDAERVELDQLPLLKSDKLRSEIAEKLQGLSKTQGIGSDKLVDPSGDDYKTGEELPGELLGLPTTIEGFSQFSKDLSEFTENGIQVRKSVSFDQTKLRSEIPEKLQGLSKTQGIGWDKLVNPSGDDYKTGEELPGEFLGLPTTIEGFSGFSKDLSEFTEDGVQVRKSVSFDQTKSRIESSRMVYGSPPMKEEQALKYLDEAKYKEEAVKLIPFDEKSRIESSRMVYGLPPMKEEQALKFLDEAKYKEEVVKYLPFDEKSRIESSRMVYGLPPMKEEQALKYLDEAKYKEEQVSRSISFNEAIPGYIRDVDEKDRNEFLNSAAFDINDQENIRFQSPIEVFRRQAKSSRPTDKPSPVLFTKSPRKGESPQQFQPRFEEPGGDAIGDELQKAESWRDVISELKRLRLKKNGKMDEQRIRKEQEHPVPPLTLMRSLRKEPSKSSHLRGFASGADWRKPVRYKDHVQLPLVFPDPLKGYRSRKDENVTFVSPSESYHSQNIDPRMQRKDFSNLCLNKSMILLRKKIGFGLRKGAINYSRSAQEPERKSYQRRGFETKSEGFPVSSDNLIISSQEELDPRVKVRYRWNHSFVSPNLPSFQ